MNEGKLNKEFLIGRIVLIGLLFIAFNAFNNADNRGTNTFKSSSFIEYNSATTQSATLPAPLYFPNFNKSLCTSDVLTKLNTGTDFYRINILNSLIEFNFKVCIKKYIRIKPQLHNSILYFYRLTHIDKDTSIIS